MEKELIQSCLVTNSNIRLLSKRSYHTQYDTHTGKCDDRKDEIEVKDKKESPFFLTQHCTVAIDTDASLGCQGRMRWRQRKMGGSTSQFVKVGQ